MKKEFGIWGRILCLPEPGDWKVYDLSGRMLFRIPEGRTRIDLPASLSGKIVVISGKTVDGLRVLKTMAGMR